MLGFGFLWFLFYFFKGQNTSNLPTSAAVHYVLRFGVVVLLVGAVFMLCASFYLWKDGDRSVSLHNRLLMHVLSIQMANIRQVLILKMLIGVIAYNSWWLPWSVRIKNSAAIKTFQAAKSNLHTSRINWSRSHSSYFKQQRGVYLCSNEHTCGANLLLQLCNRLSCGALLKFSMR